MTEISYNGENMHDTGKHDIGQLCLPFPAPVSFGEPLSQLE
jgi:hypothetical protein